MDVFLLLFLLGLIIISFHVSPSSITEMKDQYSSSTNPCCQGSDGHCLERRSPWPGRWSGTWLGHILCLGSLFSRFPSVWSCKKRQAERKGRWEDAGEAERREQDRQCKTEEVEITTKRVFIWSMTRSSKISWHIESLRSWTSKLCVSSNLDEQVVSPKLVKRWAINLLYALCEN